MRGKLGHLTRAGQPYMVAVVLGTALLNTGTSKADEVSDGSLRTINDLSRYCTTCWRNARIPPDSWTDCTQDVFCRLLERIAPNCWGRMLKVEGEERREFLRAIDAVKKRSKRRRNALPYPVDSEADPRGVHECRLNDDRDAVRQASTRVLTQRQSEITRLSLEGWSVQDISEKLQVGPERISDEKYKAIRKLREQLGSGPQHHDVW